MVSFVESARTSELAADLVIDPRSFHVFEFEGEYLLFDRATGATCAIGAEMFAVLSMIGTGMPVSKALLACERSPLRFPSVTVIETLSVLYGRGFFRFTAVNRNLQMQLMDAMWRHKPRRIQMLMAQGCNLGCRYCYAWRNGSNQKGTLMPWEIAKRSVDYLAHKSSGRTDLQVTFFGGEPLLNYSVIRQVVDYCRDLERTTPKRFTFELITNGTLLTPEIADWIAVEKFLLFVSLDGWKEMHNYNRPSMNGEDMYDVILRNALYANEEYQKRGLLPMKVRANLTSKHHDARAVGEYLASLGFKVIGVAPVID